MYKRQILNSLVTLLTGCILIIVGYEYDSFRKNIRETIQCPVSDYKNLLRQLNVLILTLSILLIVALAVLCIRLTH